MDKVNKIKTMIFSPSSWLHPIGVYKFYGRYSQHTAIYKYSNEMKYAYIIEARLGLVLYPTQPYISNYNI